MESEITKPQTAAGDRPDTAGSATPRTDKHKFRRLSDCPYSGYVVTEGIAIQLELELIETARQLENHRDVCRACRHQVMGGADALLKRWAEWATSHGHDIGILDDTRDYLMPIQSVPNAQTLPTSPSDAQPEIK